MWAEKNLLQGLVSTQPSQNRQNDVYLAAGSLGPGGFILFVELSRRRVFCIF